ncbi:gamma-glutamyl phosphate reductase [Candidatus Methanoplasma termitum]|uniref:Gamma-glutamyl phosphate reductase n=1 Tax=Candidatus Methanoplasma termitum TaxID=1577791 RepID=A0A0A7LCT8_9ARCH|nr:glutamate-5-semialdehyde dehydrogenase [Candidatus Methanoplasma termitum]AIZ56889.1 gamma-glutamyl phosphate reductase [Candidatus Methanoplasma termitum]
MSNVTSEIKKAKSAALVLATLDTETKNKALKAMADALDDNRKKILEANAKDVSNAEQMAKKGDLSDSLVKRLKVNDEKITGMIDGIKDVIKLDDPVGETMSSVKLDDDLILYQIKCPIGMLGVIFESRPDVVPQILSLCLKSGNAVAFKGGSEAKHSNKVLFDVLTEAAAEAAVPKEAFVLMESREDISEILKMDGDIDLLIPRGSYEFVKYIQNNTKIPVLGHSAGICHIYVDDEADVDLALAVTLDSKIQYPAVCNAVETLLVNWDIAEEFLPRMVKLFIENGVEVRSDKRAKRLIPKDPKVIDATDEDWDAEYNDLIISIAIVEDIEEAIDFINKHGSHHTDAIITGNKEKQAEFVRSVDSADVFINASTRFADGFRYGKGAEVGISTNKIHSRGPVGMEGLMIYKYVLVGNGQVVKDYVGKNAKKYIHKKLDKEFSL